MHASERQSQGALAAERRLGACGACGEATRAACAAPTGRQRVRSVAALAGFVWLARSQQGGVFVGGEQSCTGDLEELGHRQNSIMEKFRARGGSLNRRSFCSR